MSLLMLKTKDLTHQDHILNFELMLNPTRSGLLLNKHRSLESKRDKEKEICEVEKRFAINHFQIEKRLIERRRIILQEQASKRTYYRDRPVGCRTPRVFLAESEDSGENNEPLDTILRSKSGPLGKGMEKMAVQGRKLGTFAANKNTRSISARSRRQGSTAVLDERPQTTATSRRQFRQVQSPSSRHSEPQRLTSNKSRSTFSTGSRAFVTSVRDSTSPPVSQTTSLETGVWGSRVKTAATPHTQTNSKTGVTFITQTDTNLVNKTVDGETGLEQQDHTKSGKDDTSPRNRAVATALQNEEQNSTILKSRVGEFLTKVEDFKARPMSSDQGASEDSPWMVKPRQKVSSATVAKRYNQLSLDMKKLHSAFDKLCVQRNPEELQKIVKLASKLKANVKYARNVSFVPVMGTLKGSKKFREIAISSH